MALTVTACNAAKPKEKPYKMADGGGMYLEVMPNGSRYWRLKYRFLGREKRLALGVYPDTSLAEAREKREEARKLLAGGTDPGAHKKKKKIEARITAANTFEAVAREWHGKQSEKWTKGTSAKVLGYLERDIFGEIGAMPVTEITGPVLLDALRKIEARKRYFTAGRVKQICGQIFRYAVATGRAERDPAADLKGALTTGKTNHYATLDIKEVPEFLQALERNDARLFPQTRRAIRLLMLTLVRTSELIQARWSEIDFENAVWEIPAERMKMGKPHIVPLSAQVLELFKEQQRETEHLNTDYIFPNQVRPKTPMSNNTILFGLKRLGYSGRMTGHGFRALGMTTLMEVLGYPFEIPDTQLAHAKGDNVRRAYDRTKYLPQRKKMLQEWSDYIDALASSGKVVHGDFKRRA